MIQMQPPFLEKNEASLTEANMFWNTQIYFIGGISGTVLLAIHPETGRFA
jgi:hypothetical protein